ACISSVSFRSRHRIHRLNWITCDFNPTVPCSFWPSTMACYIAAAIPRRPWQRYRNLKANRQNLAQQPLARKTEIPAPVNPKGQATKLPVEKERLKISPSRERMFCSHLPTRNGKGQVVSRWRISATILSE